MNYFFLSFVQFSNRVSVSYLMVLFHTKMILIFSCQMVTNIFPQLVGLSFSFVHIIFICNQVLCSLFLPDFGLGKMLYTKQRWANYFFSKACELREIFTFFKGWKNQNSISWCENMMVVLRASHGCSVHHKSQWWSFNSTVFWVPCAHIQILGYFIYFVLTVHSYHVKKK